jgi:hypothetical protein
MLLLPLDVAEGALSSEVHEPGVRPAGKLTLLFGAYTAREHSTHSYTTLRARRGNVAKRLWQIARWTNTCAVQLPTNLLSGRLNGDSASSLLSQRDTSAYIHVVTSRTNGGHALNNTPREDATHTGLAIPKRCITLSTDVGRNRWNRTR